MNKLFISSLAIISLVVSLTACSKPEDLRDSYYKKAQKAFDAGNCTDARVELKNVLKVDPKFAKGYLLFGLCDTKEKKWRDAYGAINKALELAPEDNEAHTALGNLFFIVNDYDKADEQAQIILQKDPASAKGRLLAGGVLFRKGNIAESKKVLRGLLKDDPKNVDAVLFLADCAYAEKNPDEAAKILRDGLAASPDNRTFLFKLATLLTEQKQYGEAEELLGKLMAQDSSNPAFVKLLVDFYRLTNNGPKAVALLQSSVDKNPSIEEFRLYLAQAQAQDQNADLARKTLAEGVKSIKKAFQLRIALAQMDYQTGHKDEALALLAETAELDQLHPKALEARRVRALLLAGDGKTDEALGELKVVLERNPDDLDGHMLRGRIMLMVKKPQEAIVEFRQVTKQQPDSPEANLQLAQAHFMNNEPQLATQILLAVLQRTPDFTQARLMLSQHYQRRGDVDKAVALIDQALQTAPKDIGYLAYLGDLQLQQGNKDKARAAYSKLLDIEAGRTVGRIKLGLLALRTGAYAEADSQFEQTLTIDPRASEAIEGRVVALLALKQYDKAQAFCRQGLAGGERTQLWYELAGRTEQARANLAGAEENYNKAIESDPNWLVPYLRVVDLYLSGGRVDEGVKKFELLAARQPQSAQLAFLLGLLYQEADKLDKAEAQYTFVLEKNPGFLPAANNLAYLYSMSDSDSPKLQRGLDLALRAAKDEDPSALDTLGWIYNRMGNKEMASEALRKAFEKQPDNPTIGYHYASILAENGARKQAKDILLKVQTQRLRPKDKADLDNLLKSL